MSNFLLAAWTIREWLSLFTLTFIAVFPVIAMWRFFVKGKDEEQAK